ncbi:MAG: T9SS type A sorting domain-containing protein [Flavobacteriales bacterium]|nr:T9SS type A sorting domain-containing protein [Flavobacteriales bacterium]
MNYFTLRSALRGAMAFLALLTLVHVSRAQSVAREWNEVLLESIRHDVSRPTVHSRNLYHLSAVMYDMWAVYDEEAAPVFLGNNLWGFNIPFDGVVMPPAEEIESSQEMAISYAAYRLLTHRFSQSPAYSVALSLSNGVMADHGYDTGFTSTDYTHDGPAALGNYIAEQVIAYGLQDGANEEGNYANQFYAPVNDALFMEDSGNPTIQDPNRWQPLEFITFIDQNGNDTITGSPAAVGPEWGEVDPFSLTSNDLEYLIRDGEVYKVWHNVGEPPLIEEGVQTGLEDMYKWGFVMNIIWSGMCDQSDGVMWDISPNSIGGLNLEDLPTDFADYDEFYDLYNGGIAVDPGYTVNPSTGMPYAEQVVSRGDYVRILAEFWADGPSSETPPGHWFTILNYVSDHESFSHQWAGEGEVLSELEWDVRAYLTLGGGMHDVAISVWSNKGYHDYPRPVSTIRWMGDNGQCTDMGADNYHPNGLPLIEGHIETVMSGDPLAGANDENVGKIKIYAWKGPHYIDNPAVDQAGVDWILTEDWWPYQRATFVTPPFAGYISGHSTFSRCAAELMGMMTGDEYFPGGMGVFECPQNEFLVFEEGPSTNIELQWAKYIDASDQCSLSRIWGGIHPPQDDIRGRLLGASLAPEIYDYATAHFAPGYPRVEDISYSTPVVSDSDAGSGTFVMTITFDQIMDTGVYPEIDFPEMNPMVNSLSVAEINWLDGDMAVEFVFDVADANETLDNIWIRVSDAQNPDGDEQEVFLDDNQFMVDTENPMVTLSSLDMELITDANAGSQIMVMAMFNEAMDTAQEPTISFPGPDASGSLAVAAGTGMWSDEFNYQVSFDITDENIELNEVDFEFTLAADAAGNEQLSYTLEGALDIDTKNPGLLLLSANDYLIEANDEGAQMFSIVAIFDEEMDTDLTPVITFPNEDPTAWITLDSDNSSWLNATSFIAVYDVTVTPEVELNDIDVMISGLTDDVGNDQVDMLVEDHFSINTIVTTIDEIGQEAGLLTLYPNPVRLGSEATLVVNREFTSSVLLQIYSETGQIVHQAQYGELMKDQVVNLSTSDIEAGKYFVHLLSQDGQQAVYQLVVAQ